MPGAAKAVAWVREVAAAAGALVRWAREKCEAAKTLLQRAEAAWGKRGEGSGGASKARRR